MEHVSLAGKGPECSGTSHSDLSFGNYSQKLKKQNVLAVRRLSADLARP